MGFCPQSLVMKAEFVVALAIHAVCLAYNPANAKPYSEMTASEKKELNCGRFCGVGPHKDKYQVLMCEELYYGFCKPTCGVTDCPKVSEEVLRKHGLLGGGERV